MLRSIFYTHYIEMKYVHQPALWRYGIHNNNTYTMVDSICESRNLLYRKADFNMNLRCLYMIPTKRPTERTVLCQSSSSRHGVVSGIRSIFFLICSLLFIHCFFFGYTTPSLPFRCYMSFEFAGVQRHSLRLTVVFLSSHIFISFTFFFFYFSFASVFYLK